MSWRNNGEDIWVEHKGGKETGYTIHRILPYSIGGVTQKVTRCVINKNNKYIGVTPTLREAQSVVKGLR